MAPILIIGSGLAGYTVAREFRKLNRDAALTIVSRDCGSFYSKPMLSNAFGMGKDAASLANFSAAQMAEQLNARIIAHAEVEEIDTVARQVNVNGERLHYSALVLALGADQRAIDLQGDGAQDILRINDLADYARFRQALDGARSVAIMGAGLIGCEFANDLAMGGYQVSVIDPGAWPLNRVLPEVPGRAMARALAMAGVTLHLNATPQSVERDGGGYRLVLKDDAAPGGKTVLHADRVIAAVGLVPRTELARKAGLLAGRGIVADSYLQTSAPDVYTLGDCAEIDGQVLPYVMPIMQAARVLARTLNGEPTPVAYPVMPVVVKTPALPAVVALPRVADGGWESVEPALDGVDHTWLYRGGDGRTSGFALTGADVKERAALLKAMAAPK